MNVQIKITRKDGAWSVFRRLDDWGPVEIATIEVQMMHRLLLQAYADQEHEVTVTIDARGE